jgi:CheY-like chemotaxis protein
MSSNKGILRVLLVDDSDSIRASLRSIIEQPELKVVGEARNGREAVVECEKLQPDVVLLDISLPDLNGFQVIDKILRRCPETRPIFVSTHGSARYIQEAFRRGACGYVLKSKAMDHLRQAIKIAVGRRSRPERFVGGGQLATIAPEVSTPGLTAMDGTEVIRRTLRECADAQNLLNDFAETVRCVVLLLEEQLQAVESGDFAANRFDVLIHEANERKQDAKYAYLHHAQVHGCDVNKPHGPEQR